MIIIIKNTNIGGFLPILPVKTEKFNNFQYSCKFAVIETYIPTDQALVLKDFEVSVSSVLPKLVNFC